MNKPSVSILGCGFLGWPLAKRLVALGYSVYGSTTRPEKINLLKDSGVVAFHIICQDDSIEGPLQSFLQTDLLVLTLPFKRTFIDPTIYQRQIHPIVEALKTSPISRIIFTSTTAIYPETITLAKEDMVFEGDNPRAITLLNIEKELLNLGATILRLSGLYGETRKIGHFLSGKKVEDPLSPVNLVHVDDAVAVIVKIIEGNYLREIFNVTSDKHPTKKELYTQAALKAGLPQPLFSQDSSKVKKIVDNSKLKTCLSYQFIHPDPMLDI